MQQYLTIPTLTPEQEERFWSKVEVHHPAGCWEWTASTHRGYGQFRIGYPTFRAHRIAYALLIGNVPDTMHLDHLCRNPRCVNPDHLQPVTPGENTHRGFGPAAQNRRKTHCINGHEFTEENTIWHRKRGKRTERRCRICHLTKQREIDARRRERHWAERQQSEGGVPMKEVWSVESRNFTATINRTTRLPIIRRYIVTIDPPTENGRLSREIADSLKEAKTVAVAMLQHRESIHTWSQSVKEEYP